MAIPKRSGAVAGANVAVLTNTSRKGAAVLESTRLFLVFGITGSNFADNWRLCGTTNNERRVGRDASDTAFAIPKRGGAVAAAGVCILADASRNGTTVFESTRRFLMCSITTRSIAECRRCFWATNDEWRLVGDAPDNNVTLPLSSVAGTGVRIFTRRPRYLACVNEQAGCNGIA